MVPTPCESVTVPASGDEPIRDVDDVRDWLARNVYSPRRDDPRTGAVGLETEFFPFWLAGPDRPAARLALVEIIAIVDAIHGAVGRRSSGGRPSWDLDGALITEEPGAQVEIAGPPEADADAALTGIERVLARLAGAFDDAGATLVAGGLDLWSEWGTLPVQLSISRYDAMATYFARRGAEAGRLLMCASCSIQVNVDLGPPDVAARRWLLANLAAPVFVAGFAASPAEGLVNARAKGWLDLDPTRTGFAPPLVAGVDDPLEHALADTLRADVLLVERDGRAAPGRPGWTFAEWIASPHPEFGRPTQEDLATHLSTLFPESRLRGFLEVRGIDALPDRLRGPVVTLVVGLLYDETATANALELLAGHRAGLPGLLDVAARKGLADPTVGALTRDVLTEAQAGAARLGLAQAGAAASYLERYTLRGRHPSDELRAALAEGPVAAYRWARVEGSAT